MISPNGGLPAHIYTPQVTQRWPQGSEPASPYVSADWLVLYTDGSSLRMDLVRWIAGFGVYCPQLSIKHAMPNPEGERQTSNAAELFAVSLVLQHFTTGKIVIALDTKIVNDAIK